MRELASLFGCIAVLAVALGGLAWSVGQERFGKRAVAFGVVLAIVRDVLVVQGQHLAAFFATHGRSVLLCVLAVAGLVAFSRVLRSSKAERPEPKLARKRRVGLGP